ncbi:prolyl oligopeptidase family serine peptidase [Caenimonas koreensis]|uniref:S9 family peptidase n=1 Tax=Caenimonas koreensis TaxID=367474 RepID=UPI003784E5D1
MHIRKTFIALGLALAAAGASPAVAQAQAPTPVEIFFQNPAMSGGKLSPNGRYLALKVAPKGGRAQLVVMDVEKLTAKALVSPTDVDISQVIWVNDNRLVFNVHDTETAIGDTVVGGGLYAVSRDGSDYRQLVDRDQQFLREHGDVRMLNYFTDFLATTNDQKSDDIFVEQWDWTSSLGTASMNVLKLNTATGRYTTFTRPGKIVDAVMDSTDTPRVELTYDEGKYAVHRLEADGKWTMLAQFEQFSSGGFFPVAIARDGSLFVTSNNGHDKTALYRFDPVKKALDPEPLLSLKDFDFHGSIVMGQDGPVGIRYVSDANATAWLDPKWKDVQARIDKLLPNTVNHMEVPLRGELPVVLVNAYSDVDPGTYMLFNTATNKFTVLGPVMREIDPKRMATRDFVKYKARDGLEIPAWLTLPRGAKGKKLPMVVLVHGGPWLRGGEWKWSRDSQFLASRGYAVLEPEFRGSTGYGYKHFSASFKQWGRAMQNDVADGTKWAIAQGIADPARICIAGASYGGYATMMGLVNDPDLYKCGVNWVGVADMEMMYTVNWSDISTVVKKYGFPRLLGDPEKDRAEMDANSPLKQAARIKQPVLLAYGGADRRVPIVHGTRLRSALERTNPNVEWIEYTEEGHGWSLVKNRVDFWTRVDKFLQKNMGTAP